MTSDVARGAARRARPTLALVTSGLGNGFGGIGVVSQQVARALRDDARVVVWRHHHRWPRAARLGALWARATVGALHAPEAVFFEHVDLAAMHALVPGLRATPYAVFLHGTEVWRPLDARRRRALEGARCLLANSASTVRRAREANPWLPPVRVTWLGVSNGGAAGAVSARECLALVVGRMHPAERYKGYDAILDAWRAIRGELPAARLLFVGDGPDRGRLEARVRDEALGGVEFLGRVGDGVRDQLYARASALLFPSTGEGFGLVAAEAARAGVPVVAVRGSVIEELFPACEGVALAERADGAAVAAAALPFLRDATLAAHRGASARARVEAELLDDHFGARVRVALAGLWAAGEGALDPCAG